MGHNNTFSVSGAVFWKHSMIGIPLLLSSFLLSFPLLAQTGGNNNLSEKQLLNQYVQSKGNNTIVFDQSNIKQFWIDSSVLSFQDSFSISLKEAKAKEYESIPLQIQLANVDETMDCQVEIISSEKDFDFSVLRNSALLSSSTTDDSFIQFTKKTTSFHLVNAADKRINIVFSSKKQSSISIKMIILSFSKNKYTVICPTSDQFDISPKQKVEDNRKSFLIKGENSIIRWPEDLISVDNNKDIICSTTIKNVGQTDTRIRIGYAMFDENKKRLYGSYFPYNNNKKILRVVSSEDGSNKVIVDSYTDWSKGCFLTINAKEDLSDIPSNSFMAGKVVEIRKLDNGHAEITLDTPVKKALSVGTQIRVHGKKGDGLLYKETTVLHSGEEETFITDIKKNERSFEYSSNALPHGVYYIRPVILSYSVNSGEENSVIISDFSITH